MGSINRSHNEADGGILLFNGELILLYCDSVQCEIGGKESVKGRVYLTTHRLVMIIAPYRQTSSIKSLCAPFCAIVKCNVEQPIFGANYIEATVRDETDPTKSFSFKLRFSKGGAIEFAMAMNRAVAAVGRNFNPSMPPPPTYTPAPSSQYYQAPPTVYAPGYNSGVPMPVQQFPEQPPIGFIYASSAPPPYPGLGGHGAGAQGPPPYNQPQGQQSGPQAQQPQGYPGAYPSPAQPGFGYPQTNTAQTPQAGYTPQQPGGYPGQQPGGYPGQLQPAGYPGQQQPAGYPGQQQPAGYPGQQPGGYPSQQPGGQQAPAAGYPAQGPTAAAGYPGASQHQPSAYPDLSQASGGYPQQPPAQASSSQEQQNSAANAWPSAPAFNPNWQDDKKSA